jgi:glycerol kinase
LGAAYLAGLATGYWSSIDEIQQQWKVDRKFEPSMDDEKRTALYNGWLKAVKAAQSF